MANQKPRPVTFTQAASNPQAKYVPEPLLIVGTLPNGSQSHATTSTYGTVKQGTAPAAAPAAFADLTAAATAYNALRTALINAGVLV